MINAIKLTENSYLIRLLTIMSFILCLLLTLERYQKLNDFEADLTAHTLDAISSQIDEKLNRIEDELHQVFNGDQQSVNQLASLIDSGQLPLNQLNDYLPDLLASHNFQAIAVHFADSFNKQLLRQSLADFRVATPQAIELYAPFIKKEPDAKLQAFPYDFTDTNSGKNIDWYSETIAEPEWYGPYFGSANNDFLISYRAPFGWDETRQQNQGIVIADYSLNKVHALIENMRLLDSGYVIILNELGHIISHPVKEYLSKDLCEISDLNLDPDKINQMPLNQFEDAVNLSLSPEFAREQLVYKRNINARGWSVLVVLNKRETLTDNPEAGALAGHVYFESMLNQLKVELILWLCFTLFVFIYVVSCNITRNRWLLSISFSLLCLASIIAIWYNNQTSDYQYRPEEVVVANKTDLAAALNTFRQLNAINNPLAQVANGSSGSSGSTRQPIEPIHIPTGFFIQSVKFSSSNDVYVTGYIWQKLPEQWLSVPECQTTPASCLGFVLPEAEFSSVEMVDQNQDSVRWYFEASLRQEFNYLKYPFDEESIWIRTQPKLFFNPAITLVPDFDAYPDFNQVHRLGLEQGIFVEGWDISDTFFSFKLNEYSSNFGESASPRSLKNRPDLYFNIRIQREFLGVSVAYILPIIVIAFLLFAVLVIRTGNHQLNDRLGFNASTVLGYSASLFFVLVISHMSLRETLNAKGIIYLEYFFFSLYIAIAVVSVSSIAFTFRSFAGKPQRQYLRFFYWPALLLSILTTTVMRFT